MIKVYLAGSIREDRENFCRFWRMCVENYFRDDEDVEFLNPIAGKDLSKEYDPAEIYEEDIECVKESDIIFVEYSRDDYPYVGSTMELQLAHYLDKDIIMWGMRHKGHPFIEAIMKYNYRSSSFIEALAELRDLIGYHKMDL